MKMINISEAKATLSAVIEQIQNDGYEVIIGKAGKPVAKLVPYNPRSEARRIGIFRGKIKMAPDFESWPDDIADSLGLRS